MIMCVCAAISVFWCLGGGAEAGECRKQEIERNAHGDVWELQRFAKQSDGIYEEESWERAQLIQEKEVWKQQQ